MKTDKESTEEALLDCLELEGYDNTMVSPGTVTVTTTDRRGGSLVFKAILIVMDKKVLLEFRLSRGCGLEFKRIFSKIRERMEPVIVKGALTDWSLTNHVAVNAMPQVTPFSLGPGNFKNRTHQLGNKEKDIDRIFKFAGCAIRGL